MLYFMIKSALSDVIIAAALEVARRWPGWGAPRVVLYLGMTLVGPKFRLRL